MTTELATKGHALGYDLGNGVFAGVPLNADDAFAVTLLVTCEMLFQAVRQTTAGNEKRKYWLERLEKDIEGINRTYFGYLPESFQNKADKYHKQVEASMNWLLRDYHADLKNDKKYGGT